MIHADGQFEIKGLPKTCGPVWARRDHHLDLNIIIIIIISIISIVLEREPGNRRSRSSPSQPDGKTSKPRGRVRGAIRRTCGPADLSPSLSFSFSELLVTGNL